MQRLKMGGIGSPKLVMLDASLQITNLMNLDNNRNVCNIELRPKGIIIGFRSGLDPYALIIPYHKLVVYKGSPEDYSIYMDNYFVKIQARDKDQDVHQFMKKLLKAKIESGNGSVEDV
ncbi:hypothetical protein [Aequorivita ciconiae]|nr:hypothetical protein [Aequorivita sp. H23M31]